MDLSPSKYKPSFRLDADVHMPLSREVLIGKMRHIEYITTKWLTIMANPIPHLETEHDAKILRAMLFELCGELKAVSHDADSLAALLNPYALGE